LVIPKEARSQLSIHEGDKLGYEVVQGKMREIIQTGNIYSLYFVGTHKLIDRFNSH
jgi:bifunctional DNA-binding transcriptional regulator/antitoxin component of YhaV-PrlF toxin-antitoxin module